jgi:hypothetical protein
LAVGSEIRLTNCEHRKELEAKPVKGLLWKSYEQESNLTMPLYFNADYLPPATLEYVSWVDIMGTQAAMSRSISGTANFIFKLHTAAIQAPLGTLSLYPVMDGFYAASPNQQDMLEFLRSVFQAVAEEFNQEAEPLHRFIIRGGLAFGPAVHGRDVQQQASTVIADTTQYGHSILLGLPMVQAHLGEGSAPPFGIFVHESARSFAPAGQQPLHYTWWRWPNANNQAIWAALTQNLPAHLDWCAKHALPLGYPSERIKAHKEMMEQYFAEVR